MDDSKSIVSFIQKTLAVAIISVLILSRNASSSSSSCSSDLDCSLNGVCIEQNDDPAFAFEYSNDERERNEKTRSSARISSTTKGCLCDKPWSGKHCERIRFVPLKGTFQRNGDNTYDTNATIAMAIDSQGYGMDPNVTTWGGGILAEKMKDVITNKTTILYHLYVSRMTNNCPLQYWHKNSRIDHAISLDITGPYEFMDVAIPTFSHNPAPIELWPTKNNGKWKYAIFHIGDGLDGDDGGKDCHKSKLGSGDSISTFHDIAFDDWESVSDTNRRTKRILLRDTTKSYKNIHVSDSLYGPWESLEDHNLGQCNNPSPWVHPTNGTLFVLCSYGGAVSKLYKSEHGDVSGPYEFVTEFHPQNNTFDAPTSELDDQAETAYEDPFLFTDRRGNFHCIYHAYQRTGPSDNCWSTLVSAHAYSSDGFEWHVSPTPPYGPRVNVAAQSKASTSSLSDALMTMTLASRERPKLYFGGAPGVITHMVEGVCGSPACDAAPYKPWCVHCKYRHWDFTLVSTLNVS